MWLVTDAALCVKFNRWLIIKFWLNFPGKWFISIFFLLYFEINNFDQKRKEKDQDKTRNRNFVCCGEIDCDFHFWVPCHFIDDHVKVCEVHWFFGSSVRPLVKTSTFNHHDNVRVKYRLLDRVQSLKNERQKKKKKKKRRSKKIKKKIDRKER